MTPLMGSHQCVLKGSSFVDPLPLAITLLICMVYQLAPSPFSCLIFLDLKISHWLQYVGGPQVIWFIYCNLPSGSVSDVSVRHLPLIVSQLPTISSAARGTPGAAGSSVWQRAGVGAECSLCFIIKTLPSAESWANRSYRTIFKWNFHFFVLIASQRQVTKKSKVP